MKCVCLLLGVTNGRPDLGDHLGHADAPGGDPRLHPVEWRCNAPPDREGLAS